MKIKLDKVYRSRKNDVVPFDVEDGVVIFDIISGCNKGKIQKMRIEDFKKKYIEL